MLGKRLPIRPETDAFRPAGTRWPSASWLFPIRSRSETTLAAVAYRVIVLQHSSPNQGFSAYRPENDHSERWQVQQPMFLHLSLISAPKHAKPPKISCTT